MKVEVTKLTVVSEDRITAVVLRVKKVAYNSCLYVRIQQHLEGKARQQPISMWTKGWKVKKYEETLSEGRTLVTKYIKAVGIIILLAPDNDMYRLFNALTRWSNTVEKVLFSLNLGIRWPGYAILKAS